MSPSLVKHGEANI